MNGVILIHTCSSHVYYMCHMSVCVGVIDVAAEWMSDMKAGYCPTAGYYNKEACCWYNNEVIIYLQ